MADEHVGKGEQNQCHFSSLPNEITEQILSYLRPYGELQQAKLVCKTWHSLVLSIIDHRERQLYDSVCSGSLRFHSLPQRLPISLDYCHSSCILGNSMYFFGWYLSTKNVINVHELDLRENRWTKLRISGDPPPRYNVTAVVHKNQIVLFGGSSDFGDRDRFLTPWDCNDVYILDVPTLTWSTAPCYNDVNSPQPCARSGHVVCVVQDRMIVFGSCWDGQKEMISVKFNDVWIFDLNQMHWTQPEITGEKPPARFCGSQMMMMMDSNTLLIAGGHADHGFDDVWILNLQSMTWSEVIVHRTELMPYTYSQRAIKVLDRLVVFCITDILAGDEMCLSLKTYMLDCSQVLTEGCCTWQRGNSFKLPSASTRRISVMKGQGEIVIFMEGGTVPSGSTVPEHSWNMIIKAKP